MPPDDLLTTDPDGGSADGGSASRALQRYADLPDAGGVAGLGREDAAQLAADLRLQGFLGRSADVAAQIETTWPSRAARRRSRSVEGELRVLRGEVQDPPRPPATWAGGVTGRVLHVVAGSLPRHQTAAAQRTQQVAAAQRALGLDSRVVTELGFDGDPVEYVVDDVDGVGYHRLPGPARGSLPLDEWAASYVTRLAAVVRKVRPAVLHASADLLPALAATTVGRGYGIPVVLEVRGRWDVGWFERRSATFGWGTVDELRAAWGLPEAYAGRLEAERRLRTEVEAVLVADGSSAERVVLDGVEPARVHVVGRDPAAYLEVYEALGAVPPGSAEIARVRPSRRDLDRLATRIRTDRPALEKSQLTSGRASPDAVMTTGWEWSTLPPVDLSLPMDWRRICRANRSQDFRLHAWEFMAPLLQAHADGRSDVLAWCLDRATSWCVEFTDGPADGTMAWYDMALAQRAPRLAYLLQEAVRLDADPATVDALHAAVVRHQRELLAGAAFNPGTNHGFYTAIGQLAFARRLRELPGMAAVAEQGRERLRTVAASQFASDGGHLEHSPDYHRMLVDSFWDAIDDGIIDDPEIVAHMQVTAEVMGWFLRPDGTVAQVGDSPARLLAASSRSTRSPETRYLVTRGAKGVPPQTELRVLPESGYAIVRSPRPQPGTDPGSVGHLLLQAGFHSRAHKHADDLSVTWYDRGRELLIDSGRFGYLDLLPRDAPARREGFFYSRPERQYVESTRAHNTVEADGRDHLRLGRAPYGSAIRDARGSGDRFEILAEVDHVTWHHTRSLTYLPGSWLVVRDTVRGLDGEPHDFRVWWNVSDRLRAELITDRTLGFADDAGPALWIQSFDGSVLLTPVSGQEDPMRGWRSRIDFQLEPTWSTASEVREVREHEFVTVLSLGEEPLLAPPC